MKKPLLFLLSVILLGSCASQKKTNDSTFLKGFFTYYNTLFNSKDALETELKNRDKSHQDNFYAPYIQLLTYEDAVSDAALEVEPSFNGRSGPPGIPNYNQDGPPRMPGSRGSGFEAKSGNSILEISEAKALKAIAKYSVLKNGEEKNKKMLDAHILLAQARLYQEKPLEALDALNYLFTNMQKDKRLPLARIYQGWAYSKMGDFSRAEEVFQELKQSKIKKNYQQLFSIYHAETLLKAGKRQDAVNELEDAYVLNKNRKLRSRISFLRGQILANLDRNEEARESFVTAYKNANNFEFEVKSQIEIAKTYNGKDDDYLGAKSYLEKISKKGTYSSRKNEFFYALGLMANKAGNKEEAKEFFRQSLGEKLSDPQIRGLTYYEIGKAYFNEDDYLSAGAFYDSALSVMTYEPAKILLDEQSKNIKKIAENYYQVKKNDSILALTRMTDIERNDYFSQYIETIKAKEAKAELAKRKEERGKGFDTGDYAANSLFAGNAGGFEDFSASKGGFYFANSNTVAKGQATFKQVWGNRNLMDNWRTSARSNSIESLKNEAMGISDAPDPRRLEPSYYTEKIPTNQTEILALKKQRDTASLGLGRMYENYFSNTPLATKTLYDLADSNPEKEIRLQAAYQIFAYNYEENPAAAERAKQIILTEFPYTSYAEFVKNPRNKSFSASSDEVEKLYTQAFNFYQKEQFEESKNIINDALQKFPKDALVPKLTLLNAFNTGKTAGKEIMILQLEQITLNYGKTPEGEKAKEMLQYLKSDLQNPESFEPSIPNKATVNEPIQTMQSDDPLPDSQDDLPPARLGTPKRPNPLNSKVER